MSSVRYPLHAIFTVTSAYGSRSSFKTSEGYASSFHRGIDLDVTNDSYDKNIYPACAGKVGKVGFDKNGYGNYVWIEGTDGYGTLYCHLKSISCIVGQNVTTSNKIGYMGSTGSSTADHLHFGVSKNKDYSQTHKNKSMYFINPAIYLGINNYNNIVGTIFDGTKTPSGFKEGIISTNNETQASNASINEMILPSDEYYEIKDLTGVTSDWLYGRRYRIIVDLGNNEALDVSELRCKFEIEKSSYYKMQVSKISIYNLNAFDENRLIQSGQRVVVEAGYNGSFYGKIFDGNVVQVLRSKSGGVDYVLTLVCMDSVRFVMESIVGKTNSAAQSSRQVVDNLINKSTIKTEKGLIADIRINYPRGKVMFGKASTYLSQIAKSENAIYYNEDGKVNIVSASSISSNEIFDLSPENGLLNFPVQTEFGVSCTCLMNPMITVNSLFRIDNSKIATKEYSYDESGFATQYIRPLDTSGIYRVIEIKYQGDTRGQDWKMEINSISQAGKLPAVAIGNDVLIY